MVGAVQSITHNLVAVYSFEVLRTRYAKTGYFFDTNTKELQNSRQLPRYVKSYCFFDTNTKEFQNSRQYGLLLN